MLTARFAISAAVALFAVTPALADPCENVKFQVTNNHVSGEEIEIRKVKYYNPHTQSTETEDVPNLTCPHGRTCTTAGDDLQNAKNVDLNAIQIVFRYREPDGDMSDEFQTQPFSPKYRKCTRNKVYAPVVVSDAGR